MKVDLSIPAVRDLIEHFSSGMKKLRDQAKSLRNKNRKLEAENFNYRCIGIDMIMERSGCTYDEACEFLKNKLAARLSVRNQPSVN